MKKILWALMVLGGISLKSFAQTNEEGKFSLGFEAGLPLGNIRNTHNFTLGASLKYELPVAQTVALTVSAGFTSFQGKMIGVVVGGDAYSVMPAPAVNYVPLKGGIMFMLPKAFYAEAQVGAAFGTNKGSKTAFAYAPGVGYKFNDKLDVGVRYEGWYRYADGTISHVAARLALIF